MGVWISILFLQKLSSNSVIKIISIYFLSFETTHSNKKTLNLSLENLFLKVWISETF